MQPQSRFSRTANLTGLSARTSLAASNALALYFTAPRTVRAQVPATRAQAVPGWSAAPGTGVPAPGLPGIEPELQPFLKTGFSESLRVPVTAENRLYLRMLRQQELKAWASTDRPQEPRPESEPRVTERRHSQPRTVSHRESRAFAFLTVLASALVGCRLWQSSDPGTWAEIARIFGKLF